MKATSLEAYHRLVNEKLLSPARARAWAYLIENGPSTKGEVNQSLGRAVGNPSYHRRVEELERMGLAKCTGVRACRVSGFEAEVFTGIIPPDLDAVRRVGPTKNTRPSRKMIARAIPDLDRCIFTAQRMNVYPGDDVHAVMMWLKRLSGAVE